MDCSPSGFSVHGIFQARVLEWVAISLSKCSWTCCYFIRKWHSLSSTGNCWTFIVCPSLSGRDYLLRASLWYLPPKAWVSNTMVCWQQELKAWILVPQPSTTFTVFGRSPSPVVPQFSSSSIKWDGKVWFPLWKIQVRWVNVWKHWERKQGSPLCGPYSVLCSQFRAHNWSPVLGSCSRHGNVTGFASEFSCLQKGKDGEHLWKLTARTLSKEVELKECMCETPLPLSHVLATAMAITCPDLIGRLASTYNSPWSSQCWKGKTWEAGFLTTCSRYPLPSCLPADSKILFIILFLWFFL